MIKKIFHAGSVYALSKMFERGMMFLLMLILTRFLTTFQYGILATFQSVFFLCQSIMDLGSSMMIFKYSFEKNDPKGQVEQNPSAPSLSSFVVNALWVKGFFVVILMLILFFIQPWLTRISHIPLGIILAIPFFSFLATSNIMMSKLWIMSEKPYHYMSFQTTKGIALFFLTGIGVVIFNMNWKGGVLGTISVELFCFMVLLGIMISQGLLQGYSTAWPTVSMTKHMLIFGMPLILYNMGQWTIGLMDRFFISSMVGVSATGLYSVGYTVASVMELISGSIQNALTPTFFRKFNLSTDIEKEELVLYTYGYLILMACVAILLITLAPFFLKLFVDPKFYSSSVYIPWIVGAYFFQAMVRIFSLYIVHTQKTMIFAYSTGIAAISNIVLNFLLIPGHGALGAAQATLIAYILKAAVVVAYVQYAYPLPWFSGIRSVLIRIPLRKIS